MSENINENLMLNVSDGQYNKSEDQAYSETMNENGTKHYEGALGSFDFDPNQFAVTFVDVPSAEEGGEPNRMHVLRYIGQETNGKNIKIPEGLTDASFMFMHTNIESVPSIPMGVESTYAMFAECHDLRTADIIIPPTVKDGPFMFANCKNLEKGPKVIPGSMNDINYIMTGCSNLRNTPKLGKGIQYGECAFAGCKSLTEAPNVPKSMSEYQNMTTGCTGIDEAQDAKAKKMLAKERDRYEKKLNSPGFLGRMGQGFSAVMQVHYMRQAGYNMLLAPMLVHSMRKNGQLSTSFNGGLAAMVSSRGGMSTMMAQQLNRKDIQNTAKQQSQNANKMKKWDAAHAVGMGTNRDLKAQTRAGNDLNKGLFMKLDNMGPTQKSYYREMYGGNYNYREKAMTLAAQNGALDSKVKQQMSKWYQEQMSACASYYVEGVNAIKTSDKYKTEADKKKALAGLQELSKMQLEPLMQSAENMQNKYHLFNDGDMRVIAKMTQNMPSEKAKDTTFAQRVGFDGQHFFNSRQNVVFNYNRQRSDKQNTHQSSRRGFEGQFDNQQASDDMSGPSL